MSGGEGARLKPSCTAEGMEGIEIDEGRTMVSCCCAKTKAEEICEGSMMISCSVKRKAAEEEVSPYDKVLDPMDTEGDSSSKAPTPAVAKPRSAAGDKPPAPQNRMSNSQIRLLLSRKPPAEPSEFRALKERNPDLMPSLEEETDESMRELYSRAKSFYEREESYSKRQEWVREELRTKGYVELDDEFIRRRAEVQAFVEEAWKEIEAIGESMTQEEDDDDSEDDDDDDAFYE